MPLRAALSAMILLACTATAQAQAAWVVPAEPAAAVGPDGTTAVAWTARGGDRSQVLLDVRRLGASWDAPRVVSPPGQGVLGVGLGRMSGTNSVGTPTVAVDALGDVLLTWQVSEPPVGRDVPYGTTWARWLMADGRLTEAAPIPATRAQGRGPHVVLASGGRAYMAFGRWDRSETLVATAAPGHAFGAPVAVGALAFDPEAAATPDGGLLLVGQASEPRCGACLRLVAVSGSGAVRKADLVHIDSSINPRVFGMPIVVGSGPDGTAVVAWSFIDGYVASVQVATLAPTATAPRIDTVDVGGRSVFTALAAGMGPDGHLVVAGNDNTPFATGVIAGPPGGPFGKQQFGAPLRASAAAVDEGGTVLLAGGGGQGTVAVGWRTPGGTASAVSTPEAPGHLVTALALSLRRGHGLLAWQDYPGPTTPPGATLRVADAIPGAIGPVTELDHARAVPDVALPVAPELLRKTARVDGHRGLVLAMRCPGPQGCRAFLRLRKGSAHGAVLARRSVSLPAMARRRVTLRVSRRTARAVRADHLHRVVLDSRATLDDRTLTHHDVLALSP